MLKLNTVAWTRIGENNQILEWVENGIPIILKDNPGHFVLPNRQLSDNYQSFVDLELCRLLTIGAIETCNYIPQCVSPINVVPKRNNKLRLIIDLRKLNGYGDAPRFVNDKFLH